MLTTHIILLLAFGYVGLLFAIAYFADRRAAQGRSLISNPTIYALSLAVYCTAWTFYGSVGRAATSGIGFLPTYIGPTLMFTLGLWVIRKIIRISKIHRITSIADFIASRYGKSAAIGSAVTIIAVVGVIPYIALQLKAVSMSYLIINQYPLIVMPRYFADIPVAHDTAFYVALLLAVFAILFGTRHLDATERHEGLVAAIAFESLVKLVAFLAAGVFVAYGIYRGSVTCSPRRSPAGLETDFHPGTAPGDYFSWVPARRAVDDGGPVSAPAVPGHRGGERQRRPPEQGDLAFPAVPAGDQHFCPPIAFGGVMQFVSGVDVDTFVLTLPMAREAGRPVAAGLCRRHVRGHRHGDHGDHRAFDHDLQRFGHAGAPAAAVRIALPGVRTSASSC